MEFHKLHWKERSGRQNHKYTFFELGEQKDNQWNKAKQRDNLFYFWNISKGKQTSN